MPTQVVFIEVARQANIAVRLVLIPLLIFVGLSGRFFSIDRASLADRMSISFVSLLAAVA